MKRLTHKDPQTGKIYLYSADADVIGKLTKYEDLEERCIKETTWSLKELLYKWKVFYENIAELYNYRKLEEQGLLLRLKLKVNDVVWSCDFGRIERFVITGYSFGTAEDCFEKPLSETRVVYYYMNCGGSITGDFTDSAIGKSIFLTYEEAEAALEKMKGE